MSLTMPRERRRVFHRIAPKNLGATSASQSYLILGHWYTQIIPPFHWWTKASSHWRLVETGNRFVPELIRRTHENLQRGRSIDVLIAVVDRISHPADYNHTVTEKHKKAAGYTGDYTGNGVSVLLLDSETAAPGLWTNQEELGEKTVPAIQPRSKLSFYFGAPEGRTEEVAEQAGSTSSPSTTIKLPVANTLFVNGRESTIQAERWIVGETMIESTLACIKTVALKEQTLKLVAPQLGQGRSKSFRMIVPLQPITPFRTVAASMGNIIRQFYVYDSSGQVSENVQPASRELEAAVTDILSNRGAETRRVDVWAQVTPHTSQSIPPGTTSNPGRSILTGSTFHKVLSGGGGWGNKQGLLALDPERDFDVTPELSPIEGFDYEDTEADRRRNSGQIINPGDSVKFFIATSEVSSPKKSSAAKACGASWEIVPERSSFVFGTLPSAIDAMPASDLTAADESGPRSCIYIPGHFGMLSEAGMSFGAAKLNGKSIQSKIDIPYTKILCGASSVLPKFKRLDFADNYIGLDRQVRKVLPRLAGLKAKAGGPNRGKRVHHGDAAPEPTSEYHMADTTTQPEDSRKRTLQEAVLKGSVQDTASKGEGSEALTFKSPPVVHKPLRIRRHISSRAIESLPISRAKVIDRSETATAEPLKNRRTPDFTIRRA
ncbi:MAG: hypothetical protein Q9181_003626 [Wetmoreana brouardii]